MAIAAWRKRQRIDLLRTIATVTAAANPEKAGQALQRLIEESFPEQKIERDRAVELALEIMETERNMVYAVTPTGVDTRKGGAGSRFQRILRNRARRGR